MHNSPYAITILVVFALAGILCWALGGAAVLFGYLAGVILATIVFHAAPSLR